MEDSEDETIEDYKIGGYHPVHVGEIFMCRYIAIQKLGWGHFSTVWLAKDLKYNTFVALKVQKSAPHYLEAAYDEVEILEQVSSYWKKSEWLESAQKYIGSTQSARNMDSCFCVQLLNSFLHYGPNGKHFVMVFEIMGVNLLDIIRRYDYKGIPIPLVRIIAKQVLIGLDYLHRICKIIHTDLKPENVLLSLTREQIDEIRSRGQLGKRIKFRIPVYICGEDDPCSDSEPLSHHPRYPARALENSSVQGSRKQSQQVDPKTGKELTEQDLIRKQKKKDKKKRQKQKKKEKKRAEKVSMDPAAAGADHKAKEEMMTTTTTFMSDKDSAAPSKEPVPVKEPSKAPAAGSVVVPPTAPAASEEIKDKLAPPPAVIQQHSDRKLDTMKEDAGAADNMAPEKPRSRSLPNMVPASDTGAYSLEPIADDFAGEIEEYIRAKAAAQLPEELPPRPVKVRNPIDENIKTKIVDLGNGCWTYHHFTSQIQTRQYRSPEVIIGANYGTSADIWSFACMIFELITGEFLFEPRKSKTYSKDDDHLAQMIELLGKMPKDLALAGKNYKKFFNKKGCLRRIQGFHFWSLKRLLTEKYRIKEDEAQALVDFLLPMLEWYPDRRATAQEMLSHPWLNMPKNYEYKMSDKEYHKISLKKSVQAVPQDEEKGDLAESDVELNRADIEDNGEKLTRDIDDSESDLSESEGIDPASKKYSLQSDLLNVDHGPNPQFESLKDAL